MKRIKITDATATELAKYGAETLNLPNMVPTRGLNVILAEIRKVEDKEFIEIDEVAGAPPETKPGGVPSAENQPDPDSLVKIMIPQQEGPGGNEPVWAAVNGVGLWIPRDQWHDIKFKYVEALENATKRIYDTDDEGKIVGHRDVPQYPFMKQAA